MHRRNFIKTTTFSTLAVTTGNYFNFSKSHILTLSFDDGFKKSFYKIAEIYEKFGLHACLNVIASAHLTQTSDAWQHHIMGDFSDWNVLKQRGHEVMPHSWQHFNLAEQPFDVSKELILRCLNYFEEHLEGFNRSDAVYNFAYNASTPELEQFVLSKVRALRTDGWKILGSKKANAIPDTGNVCLGCWSYGPNNADKWVEQMVNEFLANETGGWLILNLHGLDEEGWGPISSNYLMALLKRLVKYDFLEILPTGEVLKRSK